MELRCQPDGELEGTIVVSLRGNLDVQGADELRERVTPEIGTGTPSLLIDLSSVDLITSAGIGALVRLLLRAQSFGGGLAVFGASPRVREVIDVVMLAEIFRLSDTLDEARRRLRA